MYGPQVCSWVLDCHVGPYLDVWQLVNLDILVLYSDLCCGFFLGLLLNFFYASLPLRSKFAAVSWEYTEHPYSFCAGDNSPFLDRVLWYCRRAIQSFLQPSFNQSKLFVLCLIFLYWLDGGLSFAIALCIVQGRYMLYKSPILCNMLKLIGSELQSYIRPEHIWDHCLAKLCS